MHESSQFTTADALHPEAIYIEYFEDHNLENDDCLNADALFVRSTTKINSKLLSNSPIKFIG